LLVHLATILQGLLNGLAGDLVEHHAAGRHLGLQHLLQVPTDAFSLPVFVGGQDQLICFLERLLQLLDHLSFVFGDHVERLEVSVDIDP
jgi:hypothetical protein